MSVEGQTKSFVWHSKGEDGLHIHHASWVLFKGGQQRFKAVLKHGPNKPLTHTADLGYSCTCMHTVHSTSLVTKGLTNVRSRGVSQVRLQLLVFTCFKLSAEPSAVSHYCSLSSATDSKASPRNP